MTGLVVITRPRDEAAMLAAELNRRGYRTLIEPMLEIVPLDNPIPSLAPYRALAFTSANGVRAFAGRCTERALPAYAVGTRTADALRTAGFKAVYDAGGDAQALAALIGKVAAGGALLHVAGKAVARDLSVLLRPSHIPVERLTLYDAAPVKRLSPALADALYARTVVSVLFFSTRTAKTFGTLLRELGLTDMITHSSALCLSGSVAAEASSLPWRHVMTAGATTTDSMIALLPAVEAKDGV